MARKNKHVVVAATATTVETDSAFSVHNLVFLANDGAVDITFNFDAATTASGAFVLKAGEILNGMNREITRLYYKTASSTAAFRALGLANT